MSGLTIRISSAPPLRRSQSCKRPYGYSPEGDAEFNSVNKLSCYVDIADPIKHATMEVSKAFRCQLPALRDDQLEHLRRWAANNCAHAVPFRDSYGRVVLMALRDRPRAAASHSRTVRTALRRLAIEDAHLRGKWLQLITPVEVMAMGTVDSGQHNPRAADGSGRDDADSDDVRVVSLR